jgi:antitoxin (DNA-binding transcriptional repressor) of toxin-antitoxin stability system
MRFAGMKELKQKTRELLKAAEEEDIIITAHGKPTAVLHHLDTEDLGDYLFENDPSFQRKIKEAWQEYLAVGGTPIETIIAGLGKRRVRQKT